MAHPPAKAARAVTIPIGPQPITNPIWPGFILAFVAPCIPTARGSTIAPSPKDKLSGILNTKSAGNITSGTKQPWIGGVAQNFTDWS